MTGRPAPRALGLLVALLLLASGPWLPGADRVRAQEVGYEWEDGVSGLAVAGFRIAPDLSPRDSGFELFNARVRYAGSVAPGIEYRFQAGGGQELSGVELLDARLTLPIDPGLRLSVGQFKAPFSEEALRTRGQVNLVRRSQAVTELAPGRQVGMEVAGAFLEDRLTYRTGIFNGDGRTSRNPGGGLFWAGRVAYNSVGPAEFYDDLVVQVGVSAAASSDSIVQPGVVPPLPDGASSGSGPDDPVFLGHRFLLGADARVTFRGAHLRGEYLRGEFRPDAGQDAVGEGWYAEAGYSAWGALDLLARWDSYRPPASERRSFVVLGSNLWVGMESRLGFHLALQTEGPGLPPPSPPGAAPRPVPGGLVDGQAIVRLQVGF